MLLKHHEEKYIRVLKFQGKFRVWKFESCISKKCYWYEDKQRTQLDESQTEIQIGIEIEPYANEDPDFLIDPDMERILREKDSNKATLNGFAQYYGWTMNDPKTE